MRVRGKLRFALLVTAWVGALPAWAAPGTSPATKAPTLESRSQYTASPVPLTTDRVWSLDPSVLNPHRVRWVLERQIELRALRPVAVGPSGYGVAADGLESTLTGVVRGPGPWYKAIAEFGCEKSPVSWFATAEGARRAAVTAAGAWDETVEERKSRLERALGTVVTRTPPEALDRAREIFAAWRVETEAVWRVRSRASAPAAEWSLYLTQARAAHRCIGPGAEAAPPESESALEAEAAEAVSEVEPDRGEASRYRWEGMMEAVPPTAAKPYPFPLARAPARRWDGLFSIRLGVEVLGRKLLGQFLVDTGAPTTVISPDFLTGQGILPQLIEIPHSAPEKVAFSGANTIPGTELGRRVAIDHLRAGAFELDVHEALLHDTELFAPPENFASCCDGVLGLDALRRYVVELRPGPPNEAVFWPREGFHPAWIPLPEPVWVEVAATPRGEWISSCVSEGASPLEALPGIRWSTGETPALELHRPYVTRHGTPASFAVECGDRLIGRGIEGEATGKLSPEAIPAATVGIGLLARGPLVLDAPHGRLWFSTPDLRRSPPQNRSGVRLTYLFREGERVLRVADLPRHRPLWEAGLRPGMIITEVDARPADELDAWDIEQRLAGAYGSTVTLGWKDGRGTRHAALKLAP